MANFVVWPRVFFVACSINGQPLFAPYRGMQAGLPVVLAGDNWLYFNVTNATTSSYDPKMKIGGGIPRVKEVLAAACRKGATRRKSAWWTRILYFVIGTREATIISLGAPFKIKGGHRLDNSRGPKIDAVQCPFMRYLC